jgi:hypothetical protein
MTFDEFRLLVDAAREENPQWFALPPDASPTEAEIEAHQAELGLRLPAEFLDFLREFGGGDFAFLGVYSMDRNSDLDVVAQNAVPWLDRRDFVAVSDNGCGDHYGFRVDAAGRCDPEVVLLDHESGELRPTGAPDWFAFTATHALRPTP